MNSHPMFSPMSRCLWTAAFLAASACASAPTSTGNHQQPNDLPPSGSGNTESASKGIFGALLYAKQLGPDHTVDFYEFGSGITAVHESASADNGELPFMNKAMTFSSLTEAYTKLNPGTPEVPAAIAEADLRTQARAATSADLTATEAPAKTDVGSKQEALTGSCSGDVFGDNWGSSWFLNNFCIMGNFRLCQTNSLAADTTEYKHSWSRVTEFAGDHNLPSHMTGSTISCNWFWGCEPRTTFFDYDVLPRRFETWTFTDGNDYFRVRGSDPYGCGHLDFAFLYN